MCLALFYCASLGVSAQISVEAWTAYNNSNFVEIKKQAEEDVVILFDRNYLVTEKRPSKYVIKVRTVHRKIQINSLYGLEQYNKLYIPLLGDRHYNLELIAFGAKVIKPDGRQVLSDSSSFEETTLPANIPFFYKRKGKVKMLAFGDVEIGDQIEYIYETKTTIERDPAYYELVDREFFSSDNYCKEKTLVFESDDYQLDIWPHNFPDGNNKQSDFEYKAGVRVMLQDIPSNSFELYANDGIDQPYINYRIGTAENFSKESWQEIVEDFSVISPNITGKGEFWDEKSFAEMMEDMDKEKGLEEKFRIVHQTMNKPLESNVNVLAGLEGDIDVVKGHAIRISQLAYLMQIPVEFHFVVDKSYGILDRDMISVQQFDNILISFSDENGKKHFMSLLSPFTDLDEVKEEFQQTECFTIFQSAEGKLSHSFGKIPVVGKPSKISTQVEVYVKEAHQGECTLEINNEVTFQGDSWMNLKAVVIPLLTDTSHNVDDALERFIRSELLVPDKVDTLYIDSYTQNANAFRLSYSYEVEKRIYSNSEVLGFQLNQFLKNRFYTPYFSRENRRVKGYLFQEPEFEYSIKFQFEKSSWFENLQLKNDVENEVGYFQSSHTFSAKGLELSLHFGYTTDEFEIMRWPQVLELRDKAHAFLNSNLYFLKDSFTE